MDGFRRAKNNTETSAPATPPVNQVQPTRTPPQTRPAGGAPIDLSLVEQPPLVARRQRRSLLRKVIYAVLLVLLAGAAALALWYHSALQPLNAHDTSKTAFTVESGQRLSTIAANLQQRGLIKNQYAYQVYARFTQQESIPAGVCSLSPSESVAKIASTLAAGCHDYKVVTFYPGATIEKPLYKPAGAHIDQTMYVKYVLAKAGYSASDISKGLGAQYAGPLFADKPAGTTLEGYIYGDTYFADTSATVGQVLQMAFDKMYTDIQANDLVAKFKAQGLNLYQGITLASIVQRELNCEDKPTPARKQTCYSYQQTIAQIFLKRLHEGGTLGSDVTYIYAADMLGVAPTPTLDSPYNTRINSGLPPGPIASPGLLAMRAVANPSNTDYNYFIAGDDGLIYFAHTLQEHEANIAQHCKILCNAS